MPPTPRRLGYAPGASASALLLMAADRVDAAAVTCAGLVPAGWRSPAAAAYRRRLSGLEASARRASALLLTAAAAARVHEQAIADARDMLAGGGPRPV